MMRSLWAGVAGLQNHQTRMDVLGNNIANVNTNGFKKGRVTFQDMLSQTLAGAAKSHRRGGRRQPAAGRSGHDVATIDTIHTQGALQSTGVMTDVALQGNGFFVLNDGDKRFYTRNGAFGLDQDGRLVNPSDGMKRPGLDGADRRRPDFRQQCGRHRRTLSSLSGARIRHRRPPTSGSPATSTSARRRSRQGPPPRPSQAGTWQTTFDVYDSFGRVHKLQVNFTKVPGVANRWQADGHR